MLHSPYRLPLVPFQHLRDSHLLARATPMFMGDPVYSGDPLAYVGRQDVPLAGSQNMVRDQRISGMNAVLWRDPSMIL